MTQMKLQRFDTQYLRDFRAPIVVNTAGLDLIGDALPPPPPPVFRESDVEHAREAGKKLGYAEGFEAGLAQANTEANTASRDLTHAMERIEKQLARLVATYKKLVEEQSAELSELVLMIARKVAGEALAANGADAIRELVGSCLPVVFGKPKINIEVSAKMLPYVESATRHQLEQAGFTGDIELRGSETMESSDIKVEWAQGSASRSTAALWHEIEGLLASVPLSPTVPIVNLEKTEENTKIETGADNG